MSALNTNAQVIDNAAADDMHRLAKNAREALNLIIATRYEWRALDTPLAISDVRMMDDLLLEATISTAAIASLLARIEHKKRYPDAFISAEKP